MGVPLSQEELLELLHDGSLQMPSLDLVQAEKRRRSLAEFTKYFWHVLEGSRPLEWNWHHEEICRALEQVSRGEIDRLVINVPPGAMKSTLVSVMWPAWEWLPGNWPGRKSINVSGSETVRTRDSIKARTLMGSELYQQDLAMLAPEHPYETAPGRTSNAPWVFSEMQDSKDLYYNSCNGFRQALTSGQSFVGARGDKIVIDDPIDVADIDRGTPERITERMEEVWDWYLNKLASRRNDERRDPIVCIMQRLHDQDLAAKIIEYETKRKNKKFLALVYPLEFDPDLASRGDPRTEQGQLLDPIRWPLEVVEEKKGMRNGQYEAQYNQRPLPASGGMFKLEYFAKTYAWHSGGWRENMATVREYGGIPGDRGVVYPGLPEEFRRIVISADTATKAKKRNDPSVFVLWGEDHAGDYWVLDMLEGRWEPLPMCRAATAYMLDNRPDKMLIEDAATGSILAGYIEETHPDLKDSVELIPVSRQADAKELRAQESEVIMAKGRVHFPDDSCPWMRRLREQHLRFPKGTNDDIVDAVAIGVIWLDKNKRTFAYRTAVNGMIMEGTDPIAVTMRLSSGNHVIDYMGPAGDKRLPMEKNLGIALWGAIGALPLSERR